LSALPSAADEVKNVGQRRKFLQIIAASKNFFESFRKKFEKGIDRSTTIVLVGTLSLIGKLFEIYFVRLIGTPNQQFNIVSKM